MSGAFGQRSRGPGLVDGRLAACPRSPNCVRSCSPASDGVHHIEPLRFTDPPSDAWRRLIDILKRQPRTTIVTAEDSYVHAEFTTPVLRFIDDGEFLLDAPAGVIHVRSASRLGRTDFGTNRKRIEALRATFEAHD
ncbi:MAG: DUF1499 domain-containing protein [Planctomycetota bacterium]|nr:DUF1499 domain-containing protein [Planctomycetaceae bacterium]MDQ3329568.1 DUF1499 domain-containing protein [Planctomycetota bacterium]